ncbi:hypothetical protein DPMN_033756 [Dreissena polymorpha]|uniref:Uncharacterized protein n=1 Tax=Dreissena polymorpha TaxID=45954 RepID=A0A9D4RK64_DREPO|nr:hypothetical protein DPMN_033756 [Dreissena polymorpha]
MGGFGRLYREAEYVAKVVRENQYLVKEKSVKRQKIYFIRFVAYLARDMAPGPLRLSAFLPHTEHESTHTHTGGITSIRSTNQLLP